MDFSQIPIQYPFQSGFHRHLAAGPGIKKTAKRSTSFNKRIYANLLQDKDDDLVNKKVIIQPDTEVYGWRVGVEPFEFTSNGGGGIALPRRVKRLKGAFYEIIKDDRVPVNRLQNSANRTYKDQALTFFDRPRPRT